MACLAAWWWRAWSTIVLALVAWPVHAHKASDAYLTLHLDGHRIELRWDVHVRDLDRELTLDANGDQRLTWGEVRSRWSELQALVWPALDLQAEGSDCQPGPSETGLAPARLDTHSDGRYAVFTRTWVCDSPPRALLLRYRLFGLSDPLHRGLLRVVADAQRQSGSGWEQAIVLDPGRAGSVRVEPQASLPLGRLGGFIAEGVRHIWMGADHVLFLLTLLLPSVLVRDRDAGTWQPARALGPVVRDVLQVVTTFTVAHSITLALAVTGVVDPPARWVEPIIAASVVLAALNNLRPMAHAARWAFTFGFGLIHGFGFAGALRDLDVQGTQLAWSLLGFNLGVEIGQAAIVAAFVPLAWWLRGLAAYRVVGLHLGSGLVALLAAGWLAQRL